MKLPDNYFDDEVRDGFFVPGIIKRAWAGETKVLTEIDKVCKKHGIKWFADYGTLLGAVRHGGFIPWDDDMDICMLREDYDRFNEIAKDELPEGFYVLNVHDALDFDDMITRVNNESKINYTRIFLDENYQFPYPAGVDVFAVDYIAPNEEDENIRVEMVNLIVNIIKNLKSEDGGGPEMLEMLKQVEDLCNIRFDVAEPLIPQLAKLADRLFSLYTPADGCTEVALMPFWVDEGTHRFRLDYYKNIVELPFENITINAPAMYDALLRDVYGDYMRLVHDGGMHNYPYFTAAEQEAEKIFEEGLPYKYYFDEKDIQPFKRSDVNRRSEVKEQLVQVAGSLTVIQNTMVKLVDESNNELMLQLLAKCQDVSVNMGNLIENTFINTDKIIRSLEDYCETIYNMYQMIADGEAESRESRLILCAFVQEALENVQASLDSLMNRREIVFLPYKADLWDMFDGLWRECIADENCDVYVIPIPYMYKTGRCELFKECYEADKFPEEVGIFDYRKYNFEQRHPDEIYIQCPYDKCNPVISVEPYFYSDNMIKYTDKLVFVPPYIIDEIDPDDGKALKNARNYICSPGVMHADKVILQSERLKATYVGLLTEFAGEETRSLWESKLDGSGLPHAEETAAASMERLIRTLPEQWKSLMYTDDGRLKKIIVYKNNISSLLQHKEKYIDKIQRVLATFKAEKDEVLLLWADNPLIRPALETLNPELWDSYVSIIDTYMREGWGIYDIEGILDFKSLAVVGDAYYGDTDSVIQKFTRAKKPVMVGNVEVE